MNLAKIRRIVFCSKDQTVFYVAKRARLTDFDFKIFDEYADLHNQWSESFLWKQLRGNRYEPFWLQIGDIVYIDQNAYIYQGIDVTNYVEGLVVHKFEELLVKDKQYLKTGTIRSLNTKLLYRKLTMNPQNLLT